MKPEEFATQFFDLWQQSAGKMMRDPAFSHKMMELMQQSGQMWNQPPFFAKEAAYGSTHSTSSPTSPPASPLWNDPNDGAGAKSIDELAGRLELCEQRLASIESLLRQRK